MSLSFYDQLLRDTAAERAAFCAIPVIASAVTVGVDRPLYLAFLASAYHHVRHTCPLLGLALSRCQIADEPYRAGLLSYLEEEKGHDAWILDDIAALGGDTQHVAHAPLAARQLVAYGYFAVEHVSPYALLGMVHVLEGMSVALAQAGAGAIQRRLGVDAAGGGFRYLTSHGQLDESHVDAFARLLERIDTPERRGAVIQAAKDVYRLYGDIFRDLADSAAARHAA
jgi:long-chain acyl-CoA synthetase